MNAEAIAVLARSEVRCPGRPDGNRGGSWHCGRRRHVAGGRRPDRGVVRRAAAQGPA
uniref:Uncharacterized protein n=1 Tax=Arundo donax TaxID=35708 RepID=A0A0A9HFN2_ARUDO